MDTEFGIELDRMGSDLIKSLVISSYTLFYPF